MSAFVLIPGAGGAGWYWHLVAAELTRRGHEVVAPDLPAADPSAGLDRYVDVVLEAMGTISAAVIVGQSMGALVAPLVAVATSAPSMVLVAPMIPAPGESGGQWWQSTGHAAAAAALAVAQGRDPDSFDPLTVFLHDVPPELVELSAFHNPDQSDRPFHDPWPLDSWPPIATRVIAGRFDRFFPLDFMRAVTVTRLGFEPEVIDTGHLPALAAPVALAAMLDTEPTPW